MILEGRDLVLGYDRNIVIDRIDIAVERGAFTAIIGPNGCGKSTLLKALSRNLRPRAGAVLMDGRCILSMNTREVSRRLAFLAQTPVSPPQFTVRELVAYGRFPHVSWTGSLNRQDERIIDWALQATSMAVLQHREIATLSGGERQRTWIAMALAQEAQILLLDEPITFLDIHHQLQVLELIKSLNRDMGRTIVMVLHDLNHAARFAKKIIALKDGRIYKEGSVEDILTSALLRDVFHIEANVFVDEVNRCPCFLPVTSV